jgi:hypothetical protein
VVGGYGKAGAPLPAVAEGVDGGRGEPEEPGVVEALEPPFV